MTPKRIRSLSLPAYLPLSKAAQLAGVGVQVLQERITAGRMKAITIDGEIAVSKSDVRPLRKEDLPEYKQFEHLKGKPIWAAEAERKYQIEQHTFMVWVKQGFIKQ